MRSLLTLSLTCGVLLLIPNDTTACTCREPGPACETAWTADAVFVGEVVAIETTAGVRRARLRVSESFRGDASGVVEIAAGGDGVDLCLYPFTQGSTYLIYALESTVGYTTSICMRTRPIANAADDLAYLRNLNRAATSLATLQGTVILVGPDGVGTPGSRTPLPNAQIVANRLVQDARGLNGSVRYEARSGQDGRYEIRVPTGTYSVNATLPPQYVVLPDPLRSEVTIGDARGCAAVDIAAQANGRIAGRVLDARGRPITGWAVEAQRLDSPVAAPRTRRMTQTNSAGRYEIGPLHPGRYLVGIYTGQREPVLLTSPRNGTAPEVVTIVFGERVAIADVTIPD